MLRAHETYKTNHFPAIKGHYILILMSLRDLHTCLLLCRAHCMTQYASIQVSSSGYITLKLYSRDSSVGMATGYELDGRRSIPSRGMVYLFTITSRLSLGPTEPHIHWALSPWIKRQGREAAHSPPSSLRPRMAVISPLPQNVFIPWCFLKHRDFTYTLILKLFPQF
jgi:hypothetical protein